MSDARRIVDPRKSPEPLNHAAAQNLPSNNAQFTLNAFVLQQLNQSLVNYIASHARLAQELLAEKNAKTAITQENESLRAYIAKLESQLHGEHEARKQLQAYADQTYSEAAFFEEKFNNKANENRDLLERLAQIHQLLTHTQKKLQERELQFRDSQTRLGQAESNLRIVTTELAALKASFGVNQPPPAQAFRSPQGRM